VWEVAIVRQDDGETKRAMIDLLEDYCC